MKKKKWIFWPDKWVPLKIPQNFSRSPICDFTLVYLFWFAKIHSFNFTSFCSANLLNTSFWNDTSSNFFFYSLFFVVHIWNMQTNKCCRQFVFFVFKFVWLRKKKESSFLLPPRAINVWEMFRSRALISLNWSETHDFTLCISEMLTKRRRRWRLLLYAMVNRSA